MGVSLRSCEPFVESRSTISLSTSAAIASDISLALSDGFPHPSNTS